MALLWGGPQQFSFFEKYTNPAFVKTAVGGIRLGSKCDVYKASNVKNREMEVEHAYITVMLDNSNIISHITLGRCSEF
jgi:hypothetical protein